MVPVECGAEESAPSFEETAEITMTPLQPVQAGSSVAILAAPSDDDTAARPEGCAGPYPAAQDYAGGKLEVSACTPRRCATMVSGRR